MSKRCRTLKRAWKSLVLDSGRKYDYTTSLIPEEPIQTSRINGGTC